MKEVYDKLLKNFQKNYNELYDGVSKKGSNGGYRAAVNAFDSLLKSSPNIVQGFSDYRGDFISSDREAAAFMFALDDTFRFKNYKYKFRSTKK